MGGRANSVFIKNARKERASGEGAIQTLNTDLERQDEGYGARTGDCTTFKQQEEEAFVDAARAVEFLCLPTRRILELARRGAIPAYPLGDGKRRVWRFRLSALASAVCSGGVNCGHAAVRAKEKG